MAEKKRHMREHFDHFRTLLMYEPAVTAICLGDPDAADFPDSQYGIFFMDNAGNVDVCMHGTISVSTTLRETGMLPVTPPETVASFDTPAGS